MLIDAYRYRSLIYTKKGDNGRAEDDRKKETELNQYSESPRLVTTQKNIELNLRPVGDVSAVGNTNTAAGVVTLGKMSRPPIEDGHKADQAEANFASSRFALAKDTINSKINELENVFGSMKASLFAGGVMFGIATEIWVFVTLIVLVTMFIMSMLATLYRKAGPHEAVVVYGFRGTRVIKGHGTIVFPMIEKYHELSLQLMSFDVAPQQDLYTKQGVAVAVEAVAQIKVKSDPESILTASEQFLTKSDQQRESLIRLVMEGHLRGIIGQLTVEEIVKQPDMVSDRMRSTCAADMDKMGLEVISFTIKEVRDTNEYIANMGKPDVARIKRDAEVATAEADRDIAIKRAMATREAAVAKAQADQERVLAETLSMAKQAEAQRDLEVKKAQFLEVSKRQQAQADKAYDIQSNIMLQQVMAEQVKIQQVEREQQVKVQEAEINRREKELVATVLKQAEMERQRIETLAQAEKQRLISEAEGLASSIRAQGEAEAEIIYKKGEAEARAMNVKAEAFQEYNQAAVIDKLFASMPEIVKALASPLSNVDKITIVSTGDGDAAGMNKVTGDITRMAAQVPALFETLSGTSLSELLRKVRPIGDKAPKPNGPTGESSKQEENPHVDTSALLDDINSQGPTK
jgi:flotillin